MSEAGHEAKRRQECRRGRHECPRHKRLAAGNGSDDEKGFCPCGDGLGQWGVRRLMRQILFAGEESQKWPALLRDLIADRATQCRIAASSASRMERCVTGPATSSVTSPLMRASVSRWDGSMTRISIGNLAHAFRPVPFVNIVPGGSVSLTCSSRTHNHSLKAVPRL